jgi:hypothetical protein
MSSNPKQHLVEITHAHRIVAAALGEWCCACEPTRWRTGWHSSHLADALLAAGYERRRDVAEADALRKQVRG